MLAALIVSSSIMTAAVALNGGSAIRRSILAWLSTGRDIRFAPHKLAFLTLSAFLSHWANFCNFVGASPALRSTVATTWAFSLATIHSIPLIIIRHRLT